VPEDRLLYLLIMESRSLALMVRRLVFSSEEAVLDEEVELSPDSASFTATIIFARVGLLFRSLAFTALERISYSESLELSEPVLPERSSLIELSSDPELDSEPLIWSSSFSRAAFDKETESVELVDESVLSSEPRLLLEEDCWSPATRLESKELMPLTSDMLLLLLYLHIGSTWVNLNLI
jgi:hypothetical protein